MYPAFVLLTLFASLATSIPIASDSSLGETSHVIREPRTADESGIDKTSRRQAQIDDLISSLSKRAPNVIIREAQSSRIVSEQEIPDDVLDQYGSGIPAEGLGSRLKRSINELSATVFGRSKSKAAESSKQHTRDSNRYEKRNADGTNAASGTIVPRTRGDVVPKSRSYRSCRMQAGGSGNASSQSAQSSAQGEANVAQSGGSGAQSGGHAANVDGSNNGLIFGAAARYGYGR